MERDGKRKRLREMEREREMEIARQIGSKVTE